MYRTIDLGRPALVAHAVVLEHWRWFKARIERIHGFRPLPDAFTEDEGEVRIVDRVLEDDPNFDFVAAEFNYASRTQSLRFLHEDWFVEVVISRTDIGDYFRFEMNTPEPTEKVRFIATSTGCRLELNDESRHFDAWAREAK
jgi:hypothetical protein